MHKPHCKLSVPRPASGQTLPGLFVRHGGGRSSYRCRGGSAKISCDRMGQFPSISVLAFPTFASNARDYRRISRRLRRLRSISTRGPGRGCWTASVPASRRLSGAGRSVRRARARRSSTARAWRRWKRTRAGAATMRARSSRGASATLPWTATATDRRPGTRLCVVRGAIPPQRPQGPLGREAAIKRKPYVSVERKSTPAQVSAGDCRDRRVMPAGPRPSPAARPGRRAGRRRARRHAGPGGPAPTVVRKVRGCPGHPR